MSDVKICPYCTNIIEGKSRDHIFSNFLGGTTKIPSCGNCNNVVFGRGFEGRASINLHKWQIMISYWGVKLKTDIPIWEGIKTDKGDVSIEAKDGIQAIHAKPYIEKSEDGKFKYGRFRSRKEADARRRNLIEKGVSSDTIEIEEDLGDFKEYKLEPNQLTLEIGRDLQRLVLKMASALFTLLPEFELSEMNIARSFLTGANQEGPVGFIRLSFDIYEEINNRRPSLAHVVYIERTKAGVFGLVQFFGVFQLICKLGMPEREKEDQALMAILDPVEGKESFIEMTPIPLNNLPAALSREVTEQNIKQWTLTLKAEAQKRIES
jgi:hypothetical protein